jgi:histidyl-tRNA synthetase
MIMKTVAVNAQMFFKRAIGVAEHYGFHNVDEVQPSTLKKATRTLDVHDHASPDQHFDQHVLSSVLAHYATTVELRRKQPLMFYTPSVVTHAASPALHVSALTLSAVGVHDPLVEVVLLKSATSILAELGLKHIVVRINSIGDSDSSARFVREVTPLVRQRIPELPPEYAVLFRSNPGAALAQLYEDRHPITLELPSPLDYLTTPSRKHFKEFLELLEHADMPYELDDKLYGNHRMYSHTMFEIVAETSTEGEPGEVVARGGRYDALTKAYARGSIPAVGIVIAVQTKQHTGPIGRPTRKHPSACLVHIGREARIRSISILETFRREKIPIEQCLHFERFSEQLAYAEAHHSKYVIIMGQREAHAGVVIVRNSLDRSQKTIAIDMLPQYVRAVS